MPTNNSSSKGHMQYIWVLAGIVAVAAIYEVVARVSMQRNRQHSSDDARLNRIRVLNQQGQPPHEIDY